ncbi:DNA polymerase III subunit delta [Oscillatoria sp. HE19RPO]|uniref:DNA polymerase III subunit delta n=1 Tax=Oscillatoria sp. HE19RPO TaxID=2954806 RepID=UPI0020C260CC|nr:DNA polymerase III subunit delta [Oscillatoria sp. HE19RPO]
MTIYLYWGSDDFAMAKAVNALRDRTLDPAWATFNADKISPEQSDAVIQGLNQSVTPPFGSGGRFVWLVDTNVCQQASGEVLAEMERTLPVIPETNVLLLTTPNKPDGRLKTTKLLQKYAKVQEFSPLPPWKHDEIVSSVRKVAQEVGVKLTPDAVDLLAESVGNDTRSLYNALEKLHLYSLSAGPQPLSAATVDQLVTATTQNSLQLASAIRQGDVGTALELVADLINRNEPALKISATLTGQFRTWFWVKLMIESGERDEKAIAAAAEIGNFKRIYFLRKEVSALSLSQLEQILALLLELEVSLKRGTDELSTLQTKTIELCQLCRQTSFR